METFHQHSTEVAFAKGINELHAAELIVHSQFVLISCDLAPWAQLVILSRTLSSFGVQDAHTLLSFVLPHWLLFLGLLGLFLFPDLSS